MGTARTIIGVWFQFWGIVLIIGGIGLLIFGTNIPAFELASLPLAVIPMGDTTIPKFLTPNPDGGCLS